MECRVLRLTDTIFKKRQKKCEKRVDMRKRFWYNSVLSGGCVMLRNLNANVAQSVEQRFRKPQVKGSSPFIGSIFEVQRSLVARLVRDQKVAGSNPVTSTIFKNFREIGSFFVHRKLHKGCPHG